MPNEFKKIGNHLKQLRISAGYKNQKDFANDLQVSKSTVGNYEISRNLPHSKNWKKMLELLKCNSLDELFEPVMKGFEKNTEIEVFIKRIKRLYNLQEANQQLNSFIETLEKAYGFYREKEK